MSGAYPPLPSWPDPDRSQGAEGVVPVRYEDVVQDGRVRLVTLPEGFSVLWLTQLASHPVYQVMESEGVIPILTRLVLQGGGGPVGVMAPLAARSCLQLAHTVDNQNEVRRILLNMWTILTGTVGDRGPLALVGRGLAFVQSAIFGRRDRNVQNHGTGFGVEQVNTAVTGYNDWGDSYSFGVAGATIRVLGYTCGDTDNSGADGTLIGDMLEWRPGEGMIDGALFFGGVLDSYLEIPTAGISTESGTLALWGKLADPQPTQTRYFFGHTTIPAYGNRIQYNF